MSSILLNVAIAIAWFVALACAISFLLPPDATTERQESIEAHPDVVFRLVNNLKKWQEWSPWVTGTGRITYEGPNAGKGAIRKWKTESGERGRQMILDSKPNREIYMSLRLEGYGSATANWTFEKVQEAKTNVTCVLEIDANRFSLKRWIKILLSGPIDRDLERGLASLRQVAESSRSSEPCEKLG